MYTIIIVLCKVTHDSPKIGARCHVLTIIPLAMMLCIYYTLFLNDIITLSNARGFTIKGNSLSSISQLRTCFSDLSTQGSHLGVKFIYYVLLLFVNIAHSEPIIISQFCLSYTGVAG